MKLTRKKQKEYLDIRGKIQFWIHYNTWRTPLLFGFTDSDWANDTDDQKSTAGYVFSLVSSPITQDFKKKQDLALSSIDAEYQATVNASQEALCLQRILPEFGFEQEKPTPLWCDNQISIRLAKDSVQHQHIKHIAIHMHFIRKLVHDRILEVLFFPTDD